MDAARFAPAAQRWRRRAQRARGRRLAWWVRLWGGRVGPGLRAERGVHLRHLPHAGWDLGANVYLGRGVVLDIWPGSRFVVGDRVKLMHYVLASSVELLTLGDLAQVGECSTLRDNDHDISAESLARAPVVSAPTAIGRDAWVARGVAVTSGSTVGDGAVIGANAVVRGEIPPYAVAVGVPARVIRHRDVHH
ncbi:MAG: hypothetical protein ABR520_01635 [Mycobacteriales bacterium]